MCKNSPVKIFVAQLNSIRAKQQTTKDSEVVYQIFKGVIKLNYEGTKGPQQGLWFVNHQTGRSSREVKTSGGEGGQRSLGWTLDADAVHVEV